MAEQVMQALLTAGISNPYPVRTVTRPISPNDDLWRLYMGRHRQNHPHQYHNGGIWPFIGGFWVMALAARGQHGLACNELAKVAAANEVGDWRFTEWFHGDTLEPLGMAGQTWNAATFLCALEALEQGERAARPAPR
jgi:glycogen debranching enzyme